MRDKRAQGALEYLLIIGGMIAVAVLVIVFITRIAGEEKGELGYALTDTEINKGMLACKTNISGDSCLGFCERGLDIWTTGCCGPGASSGACTKLRI